MLKNVSVYIHWPYCKSKCTYCAFNKYTIPEQGQDHNRLERAYLSELDSAFDSKDYMVKSIYFGGGTPSLAKPSTVEAIISRISQHATLDPDIEITLEANPTNLETDNYRAFKAAGINRLSMGIQSLTDSHLKFMGRDHTASHAMNSIALASSIFPNRISLDFIWGLPNQTITDWTNELTFITTHFDKINHLSLYQMMVERGTPLFKDISNARITMPSHETIEDMGQATLDISSQNGYQQYEVSSFSKHGLSSNESRHNVGYWRGQSYIGIGPGAHGCVINSDNEQIKTFRILEPERWMTSCEVNGNGYSLIQVTIISSIAKTVKMKHEEVCKERIVFGLRMNTGLDTNSFRNAKLDKISDHLKMSAVDNFVDCGLLIYSNENGNESLRATSKGFLLIDKILTEILL